MMDVVGARHTVRTWIEVAAMVGVGLALSVLLAGGRVISPMLGILGIGVVSIWAIATCGVTKLSVLPRLMILLYALPYSATVILLIDQRFELWSMSYTHALTSDPRLIGAMATIGLVGLLGLVTGIRLLEPGPAERTVPRTLSFADTPGAPRVLGAPAFAAFGLVAIALSWLYAPTSTIFAAQYAAEGTAGAYRRLNFNGAYLLSYLLFGLLFIDAERSRGRARRRKMWAVLGGTAFVVIFLQVLRGDRESIGLVAGLMALYLTMPLRKPIRVLFPRIQWRRARKLAIPGITIVLVFIALGSARFLLSSGGGASATGLLTSGAAQNTWTYVLLTNLGMAAAYIRGEIDYLWGATYLDYLLSLPPGVLTRAIGFERAIESGVSPSYWYSEMGGLHPVVVPFRNFGAAGAFFILGAYGAFVAWLERRNEPTRFWARLMYGSVAISAFMWFWYGDMNIIRGLMGGAALGFVYQVLVQLDVHSVARARALAAGEG